MTFNEKRITELREERGLTVYALAKSLKTSTQRIDTWESGGARPNMTALGDLCTFFSVEPSFFFKRGASNTQNELQEAQ